MNAAANKKGTSHHSFHGMDNVFEANVLKYGSSTQANINPITKESTL